jgi:Tol biopolymer transport system component
MRWITTVLLCLVTATALVAQTDESTPNLVSAEICAADGSVWAYFEDGVYDVFRLEDNTRVNLTNDDANDYFAALSPDRRQIAFISDRGGDVPELYLMNPEGKDIRQLTRDGLANGFFNWSIDSRLIAYVAFYDAGADWEEVFANQEDFAGQEGNIFVIDVQTEDVVQLTEGFAGIRVVVWNFERTQIAFAGEYEGVMGIYTVPAEGGEARLVTDFSESAFATSMFWSLNSRYIVYMTSDDNNYRSYIVEVETGSLIELPDDSPENMPPLFSGWTADSTSIVRLSFSSSPPEYEMVNIETGEVTPIWDFTGYALCLENVRATNAMLSQSSS